MEPNRLVKRRLVYHFFISDDYETNEIYKIHFACLEYFAKIFDEAVFIITSNKENAPYLDVENKLLKIFKDIRVTIEIKANTELCEAETFYNEVVKKEENVLTFFFHTKGVRNNKTFGYERIAQWVLMIYYYALNFQIDMESQLLFEPHVIFYGACKGLCKKGSNIGETIKKDGTLYFGTGYLVNNMRLSAEDNIPQIKDRWYAEMMPYYFDEYYKRSYKQVYFKNCNLYYDNNEELVPVFEWYDEDGVKKFYEFKEKILNLSEKYKQSNENRNI